LGLLKLTGIKPIGFLYLILGTGFIRLLPFVVVQGPLIALAVSLGGLVIKQILAVSTVLISAAILTIGISFFFSVICDNRSNCVGCLVGVCVSFVMLVFLTRFASFVVRSYPQHVIFSEQISAFLVVMAERIQCISPHVRLQASLTNVGFGSDVFPYLLFCLMTSAGLIRSALQQLENHSDHIEPHVSNQQIDGVINRDLPCAQKKASKPRRSMRCWEDPYLWKEFHLNNGGWRGVIVSSFLSTLLFGFLIASHVIYSSIRGGVGPDLGTRLFRFCSVWLTLGSLALAWWLLALFSNILSDELNGKTLGTLCLTGPSTRTIVWKLLRAKARMTIHAIYPSALGFGGLALSFLLSPNPYGTNSISHSPPKAIGLFVISAIIAAYLVGFFSLVYIRCGLMQTETQKNLFGSIGFLGFLLFSGLFVLLAEEFVPFVNRQSAPIVFLGILGSCCLLSMRYINELLSSIDQAIYERIGDA
jgi:hypothetical protein